MEAGSEEGYFCQMGVPLVLEDILIGISALQFENAWDGRM